MANLIEIIISAQDAASAVIKGVGGNLQSVGGQMTQLGTSLTLLTAPIDAFFGTSLKAASDLDTSLAQLNQVIKSTGGSAGITSQAAQDMASSLSKVTRYSDDTILNGENLLLTFTNIGHTVFPQATQAILDVSTAMGQDLKSSAVQVGKALNDPTAGLTALTRIGVSFTQQQKDQIKTMQAAGDVAGAQTIILKELTREFGGSAEAAGNTFAGGVDKLRNRMTSLQETIGHLLMPILQKLVDFISPILDSITKWADENPQLAQTVLMILGAVAALGPVLIILGTVITSLGTITEVFGGILEGVALGPIALVVAAVAGLFLAFQNNFLGIRDLVQPILDTLGKGFEVARNDVTLFVDRFKEGGLKEALAGFFSVFEDGSSTIGTLLKSFGMNPETADSIAQWFSTAFGKVKPILDSVITTVETFVKGFSANIQLVPFYASYYLGGLWGKIQPALQPILDWFSGTGANSFVGAVGKAWGFINASFIVPLANLWTQTLAPALQPVINWFIGTGSNSFLGAVQTAWNFIDTVFIQPLVWLWTRVLAPQLQPIINWFTGSGSNSLIGAVQTAWNFLNTNFIQPLASGYTLVIKPALDGLSSTLTGLWGKIQPFVQPILDFFTKLSDAVRAIINQFTALTPEGRIAQIQSGVAARSATTGVQAATLSPGGGQTANYGPIIGPSVYLGSHTGAGPGGLPPVTGTAAGLLLGNPVFHDYPGAYGANQPYVVGTGAQPELFMSGSGGVAIPNIDEKLGGGGRRFTWNGDLNVPPNSSINVNREQVYSWMDSWAEEVGIYG